MKCVDEEVLVLVNKETHPQHNISHSIVIHIIAAIHTSVIKSQRQPHTPLPPNHPLGPTIWAIRIIKIHPQIPPPHQRPRQRNPLIQLQINQASHQV